MNPRDPSPPARLVSPATVSVSAGSQQGPAVTHPQDYGGQPHLGIPPANLFQQQGQTTAQPTSRQQQQQYLMDGQNQRLTQNQNEANILFQQEYFNPSLINFSRPAFAHAQNYVGQANWGFPQENFIQQQGQITANPTSRQQWQQQQYLMGGQNGLLRPNQVNIPFQQQGLNQQMTITSSPALMYHQNYDAQAPWGFHTENAIQPQGQTTPQPFLQQQQQQHQQQLINEQKERLTPHKNEAFMTSKQPHLNQQMTYTSIPAIFYPENHEAQASWSIYPFIQQQGHTTPQPAQQQHQQQHLMLGQNERLSPYRNDAYMPSQLPTFNQYMATPSSKGWDSLDYKTRQNLPPLIKLDGSMENMSAPPAGPMRNMSASHAGSMGNMSASPAGPMGNMSNSPAGTIGNMSASPAGPMGNMSASPAYTMGNMSASPAGHMGSMSASPAGSMGNMSASPAGPMRNMSASPAGSMGNMSASPACTMGNMSASPADPMGNMSDSPVGIIGNMSASPAGPMGNMSASPAGPMGNMSASPSGPMRNMFNSPVDPKGNMSASHAGSIGNLSASPNDSIGNDHRIFHDLNQRPCSQPLDPIDDRFSQFPMIIAEKRNYDDSIGEIGNCILAKRPKTDAYTDPLGTSVNYKDLSGDEDRRLDSGNNKGDG